MYDKHPHIKEMMLTGGSPTMHPALVNELTHLLMKEIYLLLLRLKEAIFLLLTIPLGFLVLVLSFPIAVPVVGVETPQGAITDQKMVDRHNKFRLNKDAIKKSIDYHNDYHIKPVLDKELSMVPEVEEFLKELEIPDHKVWAMPAGDVRENLFEVIL
jgi:7-carboxy-7-deazaguanine synthase